MATARITISICPCASSNLCFLWVHALLLERNDPCQITPDHGCTKLAQKKITYAQRELHPLQSLATTQVTTQVFSKAIVPTSADTAPRSTPTSKAAKGPVDSVQSEKLVLSVPSNKLFDWLNLSSDLRSLGVLLNILILIITRGDSR